MIGRQRRQSVLETMSDSEPQGDGAGNVSHDLAMEGASGPGDGNGVGKAVRKQVGRKE